MSHSRSVDSKAARSTALYYPFWNCLRVLLRPIPSRHPFITAKIGCKKLSKINDAEKTSTFTVSKKPTIFNSKWQGGTLCLSPKDKARRP